jgi:hypothetical protein
MPPPSPVWAWNYKEKPPGKIFNDASFQVAVKIEGRWHESKPVSLRVKGAAAKQQ